MKVVVELHTHTKYSNDSLLGKWVYLFMLKVKKVDVVAITDHNEIDGAVKFKDFLGEFNITVIIGEEIFSDKGEIIGLFLYKKIKAGMSPRDTMLEIKKQGGIVYIPHPYDKKRKKTVLDESEIEKNLDLIDVIEIHNGRNIKEEFTQQQTKICHKFCKLGVVGSDAHTIIELGRNLNIIDKFDTKEEFMTVLREVKYIQKKCIKVSHQLTKVDRLLNLLMRGKFNEIHRIIYNRIKKKIYRIS